MGWIVIGCLVAGFSVSALATAGMRRWAPRWGLIDQPNSARKVHTVPTPLGGGLAIWLGLVLPLAAAQLGAYAIAWQWIPLDWIPRQVAVHVEGVLYRSTQLWMVVLGGTLISALGLIDDLRNLRWQPKLLVQFLVATGLVAGGVQGTVFVSAPWVGQAATVLWIVVLTNAFNFLDNMDGLSGGIGLIASLMFAIVMLTGTSEPRWFVAGALLVLAGSLLGFLLHNWPPAKIFMGDTGSCLVGLMLASLTVSGTFYKYNETPAFVAFAPLCVLAVPLYDFCSVVLIRLSQGRSPFHADKCHFSHRLVEVGLSKRQAVMTIHLVTLTTGLGGLLLYRVRDAMAAGLVLCLVVCLLAIIAVLETAGRRPASISGAAGSAGHGALPTAPRASAEGAEPAISEARK